MDTEPLAQLGTIARRQFGVFSRAQALGCGMSDRTIRRWVARGRFRRMLPGVYAEAGVPDSWEARAMAALLAIGTPTVLARQSAGRLHELDLPPALEGRGLALLVRHRTFPTLDDGIVVHRTCRLPEEHVGRVGAFPVTTPARTICDLAGMVGPKALRQTVAHAVRNDLVEAIDLRTVVGGLGRVRGKRNLLLVCDELSPLEHDCRSELESRFLRLATRAGIAPTAMNHPVIDADGRQRYIDAVYLPHMVGVELDSKRAHGSTLDLNDDRAREVAIVRTGWRPFVHATWQDVTERQSQVVEAIRDELRDAEATLFNERADRGHGRPEPAHSTSSEATTEQ